MIGVQAVVAAAISLLSLSTTASPLKRWEAPVVQLPYATYQGFHNETTGLDVFLGVRYAASTEGQNRWRLAQPPEDQTDQGALNATVFPPQCPQAVAGGITPAAIYSPTQAVDSEDCLFVNVYKNPSAEKQPVLVWIHGGGWDHNSAREFDPTPMINYSNNSFVAVIIQYRLGAFGFLNSPQMASAKGLNAGITDAQVALEWVQQYIHLFGGNKDQVTIWGQSAGGGTILHLLAAQAEQGRKNLWRSAVVSSPYLTPMGACDSSFWQNQFHNFSKAANCTDNLDCLRSAPSDLLRNLSHTFDSILQPGHPSAYEPCIEGPGGYLVKNTAEVLYKGDLRQTYVIAGNNFNDGSGFVSTSINPPANSTNASAQADALLSASLVQQYPLAAGSDTIAQILQLYQLSDFADNHARGAQIYQDVTFGCPDNWLASSMGDDAHRYLYAVGDAIHARDNAYEFPLYYNTLSPASPSLYGSYIGAVVSLIISTPPDPNAYPALRPAGDPTWPSFEQQQQYKVLNLTSPSNVSVSYISSGAVQIGSQQRCDFWAGVRVSGGW
ncbi:hypothetical protein JCM24511_09916 [Saitozyma sp. JCM 24511]|nr:hypothetical protein JCM24511_09916 [Saitozyma sp. JCM 24511]